MINTNGEKLGEDDKDSTTTINAYASAGPRGLCG